MFQPLAPRTTGTSAERDQRRDMARAAPDDTFRAMAEVVSPSTHAVECADRVRSMITVEVDACALAGRVLTS